MQRVAREVTRALDHILQEQPNRAEAVLIAGTDAQMDDLQLKAIRVIRVGHARSAIWEQTVLPRVVGKTPLLCLGNTAPLTMLLRRRPVAVMIHDLSYRLYPDAYSLSYRLAHRTLLPFLLSQARLIFAVSHGERQMLASVIGDPKRQVVVAPNGGWSGDAIEQRPFDAKRSKGPILYVGSLSARKNFFGALDCAIELALREQRKSVFIGTAGRFLSSVTITIPEAAKPYIEFRGQVESLDALADAYRNAACLLFPSFYEASPMPPVEAFALGCPVIASDIPSLRERCGDAALYCEPADAQNLIASARRVVDDPAFAARLVKKGYDRVRQLSWRGQAETILSSMERDLGTSVGASQDVAATVDEEHAAPQRCAVQKSRRATGR